MEVTSHHYYCVWFIKSLRLATLKGRGLLWGYGYQEEGSLGTMSEAAYHERQGQTREIS